MRDHVLIVEDDAEIRSTLVEVLADAGVEASSAANGRDALELLQACPDAELPCLIVLDLMMPVMDGWGFHDALRAHDRLKELRIVVMSAFPELAARASGIQAVAVLEKPVRLQRLFETLSTACPELRFG